MIHYLCCLIYCFILSAQIILQNGGENVKRYKLKTEYKIILYFIMLLISLYMMINYNNEIITMIFYYFVMYQLIKTIKKED